MVGHTEADHAATAEDVIEACEMAQRVIENSVNGAPDMTYDPVIQRRVEELVAETKITLQAIRNTAADTVQDPFTDADTLSQAIEKGILDAPQLQNNPYGCGLIRSRIVNGTCTAVDQSGHVLQEADRLAAFL